MSKWLFKWENLSNIPQLHWWTFPCPLQAPTYTLRPCQGLLLPHSEVQWWLLKCHCSRNGISFCQNRHVWGMYAICLPTSQCKEITRNWHCLAEAIQRLSIRLRCWWWITNRQATRDHWMGRCNVEIQSGFDIRCILTRKNRASMNSLALRDLKHTIFSLVGFYSSQAQGHYQLTHIRILFVWGLGRRQPLQCCTLLRGLHWDLFCTS